MMVNSTTENDYHGLRQQANNLRLTGQDDFTSELPCRRDDYIKKFVGFSKSRRVPTGTWRAWLDNNIVVFLRITRRFVPRGWYFGDDDCSATTRDDGRMERRFNSTKVQ
jgi:hypothetical protein